jgi:glycosyltransferase involved in cell wall biosynthesis
MSAGLPVVATCVGGAPDLIQHLQNGWLIPPGEPQALCEALLNVAGSPSLRARMGAAARARVESEYALPAVAKRLRRLYDQVLADQRQGPAHA